MASLVYNTIKGCFAHDPLGSPLRGLNVIQILDVQHHLLRLPLGGLSLLLSKLQVRPNHILKRLDVHLQQQKK